MARFASRILAEDEVEEAVGRGYRVGGSPEGEGEGEGEKVGGQGEQVGGLSKEVVFLAGR